MCLTAAWLSGSALTKQHEQKSSSENTVQEASLVFLSGPGPSARLHLFLEGKKCRGQNGRLMLFVCLYVKIGSDTVGSLCV